MLDTLIPERAPSPERRDFPVEALALSTARLVPSVAVLRDGYLVGLGSDAARGPCVEGHGVLVGAVRRRPRWVDSHHRPDRHCQRDRRRYPPRGGTPPTGRGCGAGYHAHTCE